MTTADTAVRHPAKFTDSILSEIEGVLVSYPPLPGVILDPFAGTGRIHRLEGYTTIGVEIEPEWAGMHPQTVVGNALKLPFASRSISAVVTSPCYGNRMADAHNNVERCSRCKGSGNYPLPTRQVCDKCGGAGKRKYARNTYRHTLDRPLHPDNAGQLQWGEAYKVFHLKAWREVERVLVRNGLFLLNIKDHIRNHERQEVTAWHVDAARRSGLVLIDRWTVGVRGNGHGANGKARIPYESLLLFRQGAT